MCIRNQQACTHMAGSLCLLKSEVTMATIDNKDCFVCHQEHLFKSCVRNRQEAFQQCHPAQWAPVFHPAVILTSQKLNWGCKVWNQSATQTQCLYLDKQTAQWIYKLTVHLLVAEISTTLRATPEERRWWTSLCWRVPRPQTRRFCFLIFSPAGCLAFSSYVIC